MSVDIPTVEPESFAAGDTVVWTKDLSDYLPATWTLAYLLVPQFTTSAGVAINPTTVTATDNGDNTHLATISATTSGGLAVGAYKLVGRVTASGVVYTVYTGNLDVAPDPADTSYDARSHVKKTLDAINAVLESKASKDQEAWSTADGRSLSRYSYEDLLKLKDKYDDLWNREKQKIDIAAGKGASKTPRVRF